MNQLHISPDFFLFPSDLGHHRALSKVPCSMIFLFVFFFFFNQQISLLQGESQGRIRMGDVSGDKSLEPFAAVLHTTEEPLDFHS